MRAADAAVRDAQRRIDSYDYRDYVDGGHASSSDDQTTDGNFNSGSIHDNYLSAAQNYRTAAGKLPGDDPRAQQWLREAKRMEQQARNLETNDLPTFNFSKPPPKTAQAPRNAPAQPAASSQCPGHCSMCQPHPNGAGIPLVCSATSGAGYAGSCNCKAHGH